MSKSRYFLTDAFSGNEAKRRVNGCNTNNFIRCYLGISKCYNTIRYKYKHINGLYIKISGDVYQPHSFAITEDKNYSYYDKNGNILYKGTHPRALNSVGYNSTHFTNKGHIISRTIITKDVNTDDGTESTTAGEAFSPGKFNNSKYVGKYKAIHIYRYVFDESNNCNIVSVIYKNDYIKTCRAAKWPKD